MTVINTLKNYLFVALFRVRFFTRRKAREIARTTKPGQTVLEIGSGKAEPDGRYYFSVKEYFDTARVTFIQSDVNPACGHRVIDVTDFHETSAYDHILCFHVLDDVYHWEQGIKNMYAALKPGGSLHIIVPVFNGINEPADLYRFTEKLLREFCAKQHMRIASFKIHGWPRFPFAYYLQINK